MDVYYNKLFDRLDEMNITTTQLSKRIKSSSATMSKLRNNHYVDLNVLVRICQELNCDIKDIVSCYPPPEGENYYRCENEILANFILRDKLKEYIEKEEITILEIMEATGLSRNTIKDFLKGKNISNKSRRKLFKLGGKFAISVEEML